MSDSIGFEKRDGIAVITLQRPEARNALDDGMNADLATAWERFADDPELGVAILRAEGKSFCAGADLKTFIPRWSEASFGDLRGNTAQGIAGGITRGRHRLYKPIVAAIHGHAVGGGFELALACDIRIASEDARFGVFEVRHGLHQGDGGLTRLIAVAGMGVALDLSLTGREIDAAEALRLGLVSRVVPRELLDAEAEATARQILANSPEAVRSVKETVFELIGRPLDDALRLEALYGYSSFGSSAQLLARLSPRR
jgi:enoyl-CoA hydratase